MASTSELSLISAQACLAEYTCLESRANLTNAESQKPESQESECQESQRQKLRQALLLVAAASDRQLFGICADSLAAGMNALQGYLQALEYAVIYELEPIEGPVYIKCNPSRGKCYREPYTGYHRGVLVSCQSDFADGVNETYGHLPLDLWDGS
jgi:hypothetical protein